MSYYLCLATPPEIHESIFPAFPDTVRFIDASHFPIGKATRGRNLSWPVYILQIGSSSASLVGKGSAKKNAAINRQAQHFIAGVESLLENNATLSLSFLLHWMTGIIASEEVVVRQQKFVHLTDLAEAISAIEEDVRYLIHI